METEKDFEKIVTDAQEAVDEIQHDTRVKRRSIQAWFKDANKAIEKRTTLILFAIILSIVGLYINPTLPNEAPKVVKEVMEIKEIPKVKAGTFYTINLDKMEVTGSNVIILKDAKGEITGKRYIVKRRFIDDTTNVSEFVTLREPLEALNYNKKAYDKYLEEQALSEAKEVK